MMDVVVLGVGAAGNKAVVSLMENGIIDTDHAKLLNTSVKDLPERYVNEAGLYIQIPGNMQGAGKEYTRGRSLMVNSIRNRDIDLASFIDQDTKEVILVSSVEGGTGSGSVPVIASYYDAMNVPVHVFAFIGFQDEARGMNNTLKFFKDLPSNVILHTIRNSYFLDYTKNYSIAEQAANKEFCTEVEILRGSKIIPSEQNIDDMDLYKINTTSGYMTINHIPLNNIKNTDGFNAAVAAAFENSCYMDCDHSIKRLAVVINASKDICKYVDNKFEVVQRYVGTPFEIFQHIQYDGNEEYVDILGCGLNYPSRPIKDVSNKYNKIKENLNTGLKTFDDIFSDIEIDDCDNQFGTQIRQVVDPAKVDAMFGAQDIKSMAKAVSAVKHEKNTTEPVKSPIQQDAKKQSGEIIENVETVEAY